MPIGIFKEDGCRRHPSVYDGFVYCSLYWSVGRMEGLDSMRTQPSHHGVCLRLGHAKRNMIIGRAAMDHGVHSIKPQHPARTLIVVNEESAWPGGCTPA